MLEKRERRSPRVCNSDDLGGALVPLSCVPNVRLVGDSVTAGAAPNAAAEWNRTIRLKIQPAQWRASAGWDVKISKNASQECPGT